ncbi:MAG: hypothetical protein OXK17_08365 [Thaumarchaeota archaeon]|nr:hypothetical protein [Nitrososphaerota archaeon]
MSRVLVAAGGIGAAAVMLCIVAVTLVVVFGDVSEASAGHSATRCVLRAHGEHMPVTYLELERNNPDGTYYPGDAFYYVFWWQDRSDPGECSMQKPILETEGLWLNHTSRTIGPSDPLTGTIRSSGSGPGMQHKTLDTSVRLAPYTSYYRTASGGGGEACKTSFAKPGESWSIRWTKHVIYDEPSLTKQQKSPGLTGAEAAGARPRGDPSWTVWEQGGRGSGGGLEPCPFKYGQDPDSDAPHELKRYHASGRTFFYATTHEWEFFNDVNATHSHTFNVTADNGTRSAFDAHVSDVCGSLGADSGCMYGTVLVRPHGGQVCLYSEIERILGPGWMSEPDKDGDGIRDADEEPEDDPPPPYLPPNIPASRYAPPAKDECISSGVGDPKLRLIIGGYYWTAQHRVQSGIEYPIRGYTTVTADRSPEVNTALNAVLTKPSLLHADGGYDAKNLDGTYYHDDPVHVRHEPSWKWADERAAHINFTTVRLHNAIPIDDEYDCDTKRQEEDGVPGVPGTCRNVTSTSSDSWLRQERQYGNGDGRTVYVAGTGFAFGTYDFAYNMTAYNLGVPASTNNGTDSINATLVPYEPAYESVYSYPVLSDAREYAFDDRRGIVVKYAGGLQDGTVHEQRRSFVNWWNASGGGHNPYGYTEFDQKHVLAGGRSAPPGAEPVVLEYNYNGAQSAMFTSAGYGVLHMEWPVSGHVFAEVVDERTNRTARGANFANITAQSEFQSVQFAGHQNVTLFSDAMRYPEMPFSKQVTVRSVDQQGNIQYGDALTLRVTPYGGIAGDQADAEDAWRESSGGWLDWLLEPDGNGTSTTDAGNATSRQAQAPQLEQEVLEGSEYLADYMHDKIMHDTGGDLVVVESALNDTHSMTQEWTGRGQIDATVLRTSAYFADIAVQNDTLATPLPAGPASPGTGAAAEPLPMPDLDDLFGRLAGEPEKLRMSVPLDVGLSMLPPTSVYISVNGGPERASHHKYYAFGGSETISINVQTDNALDLRRAGTNGSAIVVRQPDNFGVITALEVNGTEARVRCATGCVLANMPSNATVSVLAYNEWGGTASGLAAPAEAAAPGVAEDPAWAPFAGAVLLLAIGAYAMKKLFGKSMFGGGR